jgi:hypothetical protein
MIQSRQGTTRTEVKRVAVLILGMACCVTLANTVIKFDMFESLTAQFLKLTISMGVFILIAGILGKVIAIGLPIPSPKSLLTYSRNLLLASGIGAVGFSLTVFTSNSFEWFWPTPIPICSSLFLVITLLSNRCHTQRPNQKHRMLAEFTIIVATYVILTDIYKHLLNLDMNNLISIGIIAYLSMIADTKNMEST